MSGKNLLWVETQNIVEDDDENVADFVCSPIFALFAGIIPTLSFVDV